MGRLNNTTEEVQLKIDHIEDGYIYFKDDITSEGNIRFSINDDGIPQVEKYSLGTWSRTEFELAPSTLFLGKNLAISTAGHFLVTEDADGSNKILYVHSNFTDSSGTGVIKVVHLDSPYTRLTIQDDDSGEISGTEISVTLAGIIKDSFSKAAYLRVGSIEASSYIDIITYDGPSDTDPVIWNDRIPSAQLQYLNINVTSVINDSGDARFYFASGNEYEVYIDKPVTLSGFTNYTNGNYTITEAGGTYFKIGLSYVADDTGTWSSNERKIDLRGMLEINLGNYYLVKFISPNTLSFKADATNSVIWFHSDGYTRHNNELLGIKEWTENDSRTKGEWFISHYDRKIYVAKSSGTKGATFAGEKSSEWKPLSDDILASKMQSTGLLSGGVLSLASSTTVSWTAGTGQIVDYTDPEDPLVTQISWDAVTGYTPTNIATDGSTIFGYDVNGTLVEILATALTAQNQSDYIIFGFCTHEGGSIINLQPTPGNLGYGGVDSFRDFMQFVIGPANISGNIYSANGSNLNIDVIGGQAMFLGSNFRNNTKVPDIITLSSGTAISFARIYNEADPSLNITFESLTTTSIDPTKYDDGTGTLATVTTDYWTIPRIFRSRDGGTFVSYGQDEYATKSLATEALTNEIFNEKSPLPWLLFRAYLVVKQSATDLSDTSQAEFFECSSFRTSGISSSTSTVPGITSPGGSDGNVQYNDSGSFGGESNFTYNDTTNVVSLSQDTNNNALSISGSGITSSYGISLINFDNISSGGRGINITSDSANSGYSLANFQIGSSGSTSSSSLRTIHANNGIAIYSVGKISEISNTTTGTQHSISADTITTGDVLYITANAITSGSMLHLSSTSSDTTSRDLAYIINGNAASTGTTCLKLVQNSTGSAIYASSASTTGIGVQIITNSLTSGDALNIETSGNGIYVNTTTETETGISIVGNNLTTGMLLDVSSSSSDSSTRYLTKIENSSSSATGTTPLYIYQSANNTAVNILASGVTNANAINVEADNLILEGSIARFYSNSSNTQVRDLVTITNNNVNATEATCLAVYQKGDAPGVYIESDGTTSWGIEIASHYLTTGKLGRLHSNSSDTSTRNLFEIINDSPSATGTTVLYLQQDSTGLALNSQGNVDITGNLDVSGTIDSQTDFTLYDLSIDLTVPGVIYNQNHLAKVDETHINIYAGEANIRKSDGTLHRVSWSDNLNYEVSLGLTIPWVTYEWNVGETDIQLNIRDTLPTTLEELEEIAVIGRVWVEAGVLYASSRHMLLANDRYTNRAQAWKYPSYNYNVIADVSALDSNYIQLSTGELFRWPIVAETTGHHTHYFSGDTQITYIWGHLQGQTTHDEILDDSGGDAYDIADIANWYDNGGTPTAVPNNKFVIHQIGAYAISEVLVWFRGQNVYDSMAEALSSVQSENLTEATWASDTSQISKISWVILKQNTTDFSNTADCRFITVTGSGTSAGTGVTTFMGLTDTPITYTGNSNKLVHTNSGESVLEFTDDLKWDNTNSKLTLTTDSITSGYGFNVTTASTDTNQWSLGRFAVTNSAAVGAAALDVSTASESAVVLQLTGGQVLQTYTGSTGIGYYYYANNLTTGTALHIEASQLTTGRVLNISSVSTDSNVTLAEMSLDSGASVNARVLVLDHAGSNGGTALDMTGNMRFTGTATTATSFDVNGNTNTTGNVIDLYGSALTTASLLRAYSNSADTSVRSLIHIINDNSSSTNTVALDIQQDGNSRGIRLAADGITTGIGLDVYGSGLTSGTLASFYSDGSSTSARNLVQIINDNVLATGTTSLYIRNDTNNQSLNISGVGVTSSKVVNIEANSISSGQILRVYSNSSDSTVRALTYIVNDNVAATGARLLQMQQDANAISWYLDQNGDGNAIYLDGTGNSTHDCIRVDANNITTASIARFYSNSSSTSFRNLIEIINDNVLADGVVSLYVQNDADAIAIQANGDVEIGGETDMIGDTTGGNVLDIDGDTLTTGNALYVHADSLTTGYVGYFYSNSSDTSARNLVRIANDNTAATATIPLVVQQDADYYAAIIGGDTSIGGLLEVTGRVGINTTPDSDADLHILTSSGEIISRLESESLSTTNRAAYQVIGNSGSGYIYAELGVVYYDQSSSGGTNGPCAYLHLQQGDGETSYLWVDNSGILRIGSLGQVGSTNGTVVGTQT